MTAIIIRTKFGPMLAPAFDQYIVPGMIRYGQYCVDEWETWEPFVPEGGVVVDAGSNIGAHTLAFSHAVGPSGVVFAIEPQRMLANMLAGSLALNGIRNVFVKQCAIGRERGQVMVPALDYDAAGNFGGLSLGQFMIGEPVPLITLDGLELPRLDFLKLDIEGMEAIALEGAEQTIRRCRPAMSIEADRQEQLPRLLELLSLHEYRAWWHRPPLGDLWPGIVSLNLFCVPSERAGEEPFGVDEVAL